MEVFIVPNPTFIPIAFATNGFKNTIQKTRQPTQPAEDMTWADGTPPITTTPLNDGGKAPKGQDFNGVLFVATENGIFVQNGNRYKWSADVVTHYGGYAKDAIVQSDDGIREFISLVDNNTVNPNVTLGSSWMIYAGVGSVPAGTSTTAGVLKVINSLNSTDVGSALSAAQGKEISDSFVSSRLQNGYQKLLGGLIIQWGSVTVTNSTVVTQSNFSFPIPFPNACVNFNVSSTQDVNASANPHVSYCGLALSRSEARISSSRSSGQLTNVFTWFAIGY